MLKFPKDFIWGTATASYQIEGAANEDGRGVSIWDHFSKTPGKVYKGHNGDIACDHYHRYKDDIQMMSDLNIESYRFSIAWPRIFPEKGKFNQKGIDFYKKLVDELMHKGIKPAATIYHWDLPQYLQERGGWVNRDTVNYFQEYAETLYRELGDVIPSWITHNEPWCASFLSYGIGHHAPGHQDWNEAVRASHHLLLSHGLAVKSYRSSQKGEIGITLNLNHVYPETAHEEDLAAAYRSDGFTNRWFLDPLFKGQYPKDMLSIFSKHLKDYDFIQQGDLDIISEPIDFLGINYYTRALVKAGKADELLLVENLRGSEERTDMDWEVYPKGLYDLLTRIKEEYSAALPLYITENGAAYPDKLLDGKVNDQERISYIENHLQSAQKFIEEGGNLKGYYVWSLMDNFEWAFGYSKRFGIVYVDYKTQERILKESAKWYRDIIKETKH